MYRGTEAGTLAEITFVKNFNSNKLLYRNYLLSLNISNFNNIHMVRVTTKQFSKLSNQVVMTRADAYLINSTDIKIKEVLSKYDYYIDENILKENNIVYKFIEFSGVSIKISDSKNFQILKLTPDSFFFIFKEYELGAGASVYCLKEEELIKNELVFKGWKTSKDLVVKKYSTEIPELIKLNYDIIFSEQLSIYKQLKDFSNKRISEIINKNKYIQEIIFNGFHIYDEPYSASYFYHGHQIEKLNFIPFIITTGSGRSKGNFTIVLKPKNETIE